MWDRLTGHVVSPSIVKLTFAINICDLRASNNHVFDLITTLFDRKNLALWYKDWKISFFNLKNLVFRWKPELQIKIIGKLDRNTRLFDRNARCFKIMWQMVSIQILAANNPKYDLLARSRQTSLIILSELIDLSPSPLKSSDNLWFSDDFRGNRS